MSKNFYVILPSNTPVVGNRTNSFRVRLPKKLQFNSDWSVGLAVLHYPHTWPVLGTTKQQSVTIFWKTGESLAIIVPSTSFKNPEELLKTLKDTLYAGSHDLVQKLRSAYLDDLKMREKVHANAEAEMELRKKARADALKAIPTQQTTPSSTSAEEEI